MQITKCRICGSTSIVKVLSLGNQPWGNDFLREPDSAKRFPLELYYCKDCTLVQLGFTIPKEQMFVDHTYMSGTTKTLRKHFYDLADTIVTRFKLGKKDLVVDIGGNDGTQLLGYKRHNLRVLNVESGRNQAKESVKSGIPVVNNFFNAATAKKIIKTHGSASIINAAGVFFHLEELHSVVEGIKLLLAPKGVFVVQFIYLGDMVEKNSFDNVYHEHLLYYTLKSLGNLFSGYGLEIFDVERSPIHGGSLVASVSHKGARTISTNVCTMQKFEQTKGYDKIKTYRTFAANVKKIRDGVVAAMTKAHLQKKTVFGYGAPVKGTTMLNYCGINSELMQCAVEKNPLKCQRYYPGTDIPVIHETLARIPDYYLILAWNFLDEFIEKEKTYLLNGGKFIVPVPTPRIIDHKAVS